MTLIMWLGYDFVKICFLWYFCLLMVVQKFDDENNSVINFIHITDFRKSP